MRSRIMVALVVLLQACGTVESSNRSDEDAGWIETADSTTALMYLRSSSPGLSLEYKRSAFGPRWRRDRWPTNGYDIVSSGSKDLYVVCALKSDRRLKWRTGENGFERPFLIDRRMEGTSIGEELRWDVLETVFTSVPAGVTEIWFPVPLGPGSFRFGLQLVEPTEQSGLGFVYAYTPELRIRGTHSPSNMRMHLTEPRER